MERLLFQTFQDDSMQDLYGSRCHLYRLNQGCTREHVLGALLLFCTFCPQKNKAQALKGLKDHVHYSQEHFPNNCKHLRIFSLQNNTLQDLEGI